MNSTVNIKCGAAIFLFYFNKAHSHKLCASKQICTENNLFATYQDMFGGIELQC